MDNHNEMYHGDFVSSNNDKGFSEEEMNAKPITQTNPSKEESIAWDLELWKRAEQTKFKAYLKQLEYEFLSRLSMEYKTKEDEREKEIKDKVNELNVLQTRLKKKSSELETRESKLHFLEEELKLKINEVARQLSNKDEEISYLKNRFKEERMLLEKDKLALSKQINEKQKIIETIENNFNNYKREINDSPLSVIKNELSKRTIELEEANREIQRINLEKEKYKTQCEKLKLDLIKIKKVFEQEKETLYKQKIDEVEKLKFEIYNQRVSHSELQELQELRNKIKNLTEKEETKQPPGKEIYTLPKKEYKFIKLNSKVKSCRHNEEIDVQSELERLYYERNSLLSNGMYSESDPLIMTIDCRIKKLLES